MYLARTVHTYRKYSDRVVEETVAICVEKLLLKKILQTDCDRARSRGISKQRERGLNEYHLHMHPLYR